MDADGLINDDQGWENDQNAIDILEEYRQCTSTKSGEDVPLPPNKRSKGDGPYKKARGRGKFRTQLLNYLLKDHEKKIKDVLKKEKHSEEECIGLMKSKEEFFVKVVKEADETFKELLLDGGVLQTQYELSTKHVKILEDEVRREVANGTKPKEDLDLEPHELLFQKKREAFERMHSAMKIEATELIPDRRPSLKERQYDTSDEKSLYTITSRRFHKLQSITPIITLIAKENETAAQLCDRLNGMSEKEIFELLRIPYITAHKHSGSGISQKIIDWAGEPLTHSESHSLFVSVKENEFNMKSMEHAQGRINWDLWHGGMLLSLPGAKAICMSVCFIQSPAHVLRLYGNFNYTIGCLEVEDVGDLSPMLQMNADSFKLANQRGNAVYFKTPDCITIVSKDEVRLDEIDWIDSDTNERRDPRNFHQKDYRHDFISLHDSKWAGIVFGYHLQHAQSFVLHHGDKSKSEVEAKPITRSKHVLMLPRVEHVKPSEVVNVTIRSKWYANGKRPECESIPVVIKRIDSFVAMDGESPNTNEPTESLLRMLKTLEGSNEETDLLREDIKQRTNLASIKVRLEPHQCDALLSLCFNIGETRFENSSVVKRVNLGDFEGAIEYFGQWHFLDKRSPEICMRLLIEASIFHNKSLCPDSATPPSAQWKLQHNMKDTDENWRILSNSEGGYLQKVKSICDEYWNGSKID